MSCLFCDSLHHLSQFCKVHTTDYSRQKIAYSKKYCHMCFAFLDNGARENHTAENCKINQKCYICFSKEHHMFLCLESLTVKNHFFPNIDMDLLSRFIQIFDPFDQFLIALTSSAALNACSPKIIKVFDGFYDGTNFKEPDILVVTGTIQYRNPRLFYSYYSIQNNIAENYKTLYERILARSLIIKAKNVKLQSAEFSRQGFFYFLSFNTKVLECTNLKITEKITFAEIIQEIPFIESLVLDKTNFEITNTWPNDLFQYKKKWK